MWLVSACADAKTLELVAEKEGAHAAGVMSVCFSPDGGRIVSGGDDKAIKLWGMCIE